MTPKPMPSGGGSYVRQADGKLLTHEEAAKAAEKAAEKALKKPVKED